MARESLRAAGKTRRLVGIASDEARRERVPAHGPGADDFEGDLSVLSRLHEFTRGRARLHSVVEHCQQIDRKDQ